MDCQQWENPYQHWSEHSPMFLLWVTDDTYRRVQEFVSQPHRGTLRTSMDLGRRTSGRGSWYAFVFEQAPEAALLFRLMFEDCLRMHSAAQVGEHGYGVDFRVELMQNMWRG
jgi:hypothetical protein